MNSVTILGRLTKDAETRQAGQTTVTNFTVAVDRPYTKDGGEKKTDFINCQLWGKRGEVLKQYTAKGDRVLITGELRVDSYTNKDGKQVYSTYVFGTGFDFIERKQTQPTQSPQYTAANVPAPGNAEPYYPY